VPPRRQLELVRSARRRLDHPRRPARTRVADVALFYGERSGGIRTYLDAKARWGRTTPSVDHHVVVPGESEDHDGGWHELPSLRVAASNGYREPIGVGALKATLSDIRPDVVLLHDPFWNVLGVVDHAHAMGAAVVAVHHGSAQLDAAGLPGPDRLWQPLLRAWMRHACARVEAVMAAVNTAEDCGRPADLPLRFGVHPAFHPRAGIERGDHVLYAGRLAREKGVVELLEAAARSDQPWPLRIVGSGPLLPRLARRAQRPDLAGRVTFADYIRDPHALAREYAAAGCVVMPGPHETFGLVALEAAASGARVVVSATAPSAAVIGRLGSRFAPGSARSLVEAIERARLRPRDLAAAAALAERSTWDVALAAELEDLRALCRRPASLRAVA
jgi:alpha-1,6-mannosyltransferase